jgi:hypothetical protein
MVIAALRREEAPASTALCSPAEISTVSSHAVGKIVHQYVYADQKDPNGQHGEAPADVVAADQNGECQQESDISDPSLRGAMPV